MSNKRVQFRRGTSAEHTTTNGGFTGAAGEVTVDTTNISLRVHDNSTAGGIEVARADLENISPDQAVDFNGQKLSNIAAPTSTTDAATKAYVDASFAGGNLSQLTDVSLGTLSSGELIAYNGSDWVNVGISGDATLNSSGVLTISADSVENSMLADNAVDTAQIVDSAVTNAKIASSYISVTDGTTSNNVSLGGAITFAGTTNQTTVSQSNGTVTVGLTDDLTVAATLTVSGNLIVSGTTTTVNTATVSIQDNIMTLNSDATGTPTENAGLEVERGDSTNATLQWNETSDDWEVSIGGSTFYEIAHAGNANSVITSMITDDNVTTDKLADNAVTEAKISDGAVTTSKIADSAVTDDHLADDSVTTAAILDSNVTTAKIAADAITNAKIADDAVGVEHIGFFAGTIAGASGKILVGNGSSAFAEVAVSGDLTLSSAGSLSINGSAVTTGKINDGAVTTIKLGADAVDGTKIADDSIDSEHIVDGSIDTAHISDDAITVAKIAVIDDTVVAGNAKILIGDGTDFSEFALSGDVTMTSSGVVSLANDTVSTDELTDNAVATANIANNAVTPAKVSVFNSALVASSSGQFLVTDGTNGFTNVAMSGDATLAANGAITIANNAVETAMIADANVTNAKMAGNSVGTSNIIDANVTNAKLASNAVATANIVDDAVTQAKINAGAVGTTELAADSVTSAKITDANVTTAKIADANVTTAKIADDAVTQGKIASGAVGTTEIANSAVTETQLAASVAGSGLSGGAGSALSVNVDDATVEFNGGGDIALKASGVSSAKIADAAIVEAKIASGAVTTAKIASAAITTTLLADSNVTTAKIADSAVTNGKLANSTITFSANSGTADAVSLGETIAIIGTSNEVETSVSNNQIQVGLPNSVTISDSLTVTEDITVLNGDLALGSDSSLTVSGLINVSNQFSKVTVQASNGVEIDGILRTDAGIRRMVHAGQTGTVTVGNTHHIIICSATATVNLPSAGTSGRELIIKNASASDTVTIAASAGETSEITSLSAAESVTLVSDGSSDWYSI